MQSDAEVSVRFVIDLHVGEKFSSYSTLKDKKKLPRKVEKAKKVTIMSSNVVRLSIVSSSVCVCVCV